MDEMKVRAARSSAVRTVAETNVKYTGSVGELADGQSGGETPGPIPNPAVKPTGVPRSTEVREPTGDAESCQPPGSCGRTRALG